MRRVRRALNAAASARDGAHRQPLMDSHTGAGRRAPPGLAYLSHFPYLDSFWFAEGLNLEGPPGYWLLEASGQIHGISGDLLSHSGSTASFRAMLFGMTVRNSPEAEAVWRLWDAAKINETELIGWWEPAQDRPVHLSLAQTRSASDATANNCSIVHTGDSYPASSGGAAGNIGFGGKPCGRPEPTNIPAMTAVEAVAYCCGELAGSCVGFSFDAAHTDAGGKSGGCFKRNARDGHSKGPAGFEGFTLQGSGPGRGGQQCGLSADNTTAVLTTVYNSYGSHAIVAIASWCEQEARGVTLDVNWEALGLDAATVRITQPAIGTLQTAKVSVGLKDELVVAARSGVILVMQK